MKVKLLALIALICCLASGISNANTFYSVGLDQYANDNNHFDTFPTGDVSFDGIPFHIRDTDPAFIATVHEIKGWSDNILIPTSIPSPRAIHILITAGNMYLGEMGVQVGTLRFVSNGGLNLDVPLIGGENIREWSPYSPNMVINTLSDPNAREIWSGIWNGWMTVPARVDLYTVYLPEGMDSLQMIEIHDIKEPTSLGIFGITVEAVPEPTSLLAVGSGLFSLGFVLRRRKH